MESSSGKSRSTNPAFKECLKKGKIKPFPRAKNLATKELAAAEDDLSEAQDRFRNGRFKYATINAYYAIFHAARALLYSKGYRERSHFCLSVALESLFVESGLLGKRITSMLRNNMILREEADYGGSFSRENAQVGIANAWEFLEEAKELLNQPRT